MAAHNTDDGTTVGFSKYVTAPDTPPSGEGGSPYHGGAAERADRLRRVAADVALLAAPSYAERWERMVAETPEPDALMGVLEAGKVTLLIGESNAGKSRLAHWIAGHWSAERTFAAASGALASGMFPYLDEARGLRRLRPPRVGAVLYLSADAEGADVARTVRNFRDRGAAHLGCAPEVFAHGGRFYVVARDTVHAAVFRTYYLGEGFAADALTALAEGVRRAVQPDAPEAVQLLIVADTFARLSPGSELDNAYRTRVVDELEEAASRTGAAVLVLDHVAKGDHGKPLEEVNPLAYGRGGTGLAAAARTVLVLVRDRESGGRVVGMKGEANNLGLIGPVYFEVHSEAEGWGVHYFRPIPLTEVERIRAAVSKATGTAEPDAAALLAELVGMEAQRNSGPDPVVFTLSEVRSAVGSLWSRSPKGPEVRALTDQLLTTLAASGWAEVRDVAGNAQRRVVLTDAGRECGRAAARAKAGAL